MKKIIQFTLTMSGLLLAGFALAVPFTFSSGQPAHASEVNDNFTDVEGKIQANTVNINNNAQAITNSMPVKYDYRNYMALTNNTKTYSFNTDDPSVDCTSETRVITLSGTDMVIREIRNGSPTTPSGRCWVHDIHMTANTEGVSLNYLSFINVGDQTTEFRRMTLDTPVMLRGASMLVGSMAANATTSTQSIDTAATGAFFESDTLVGIEDVTVPFGSYTGCLRIARHRSSSLYFGDGMTSMVSWFCPNVGLVKNIAITGTGIHVVKELTNYTTP